MTRRVRMFTFIGLILVVFLATASTLITEPLASGDGQSNSAQEWVIVVLDPTANRNDVAQDNGIAPVKIYEHAINGFAMPLSAAEQVALAQDSRVIAIVPDSIVSADGKGGNGGGGKPGGGDPTPEPTPDPSGQTLPTGVDRIDAEGGGNYGGVTVAVLDTGIEASHPDLNVVGGVDCTKGSTGCKSGGNDRNGHGTHNAGIIGALDNGSGVVGVAPGASLFAVKVLGDDGTGPVSNVIRGLDYVIANSSQFDVVNMSLSAREVNPALHIAIQNTVNTGLIVMASAGNNGFDVFGWDGEFGAYADVIPGAYPEVATVAALSDTDGQAGGYGPLSSYGSADSNGDGYEDGLDDSFAWFSDYSQSTLPGNPVSSPGAAIDLVLPGVDIYSTWVGGGYNTLSGTSAATAHGSGLAVRYIAQHGRASDAAGVYAIRQALINAAMDQASGLRLASPGSEPDANPEPMGYAGN